MRRPRGHQCHPRGIHCIRRPRMFGPSVADSFEAARERVRRGLADIGSGRPASYIACWHDSPHATLFGAWGPVERGYPNLAATFAWVGSRFRGGALVAEDIEIWSSGDLAYTVGFERGIVTVDAAPP